MTNRSLMKTVDLEPNQWTLIEGRYLQVKGQKQIRLALYYVGDNMFSFAPPANDNAYFLTPGFDSKPVDLFDYYNVEAHGFPMPVYAMPDDAEPVTVVVCEG